MFSGQILKITLFVISDCEADDFRCGDGSCIWNAFLCDGEVNCPNDDDDETRCGKYL